MDFKEKICPICSVAFEDGDDVVVCPRCGAPYHRDCYKEKGKCIFTDLHKEKKAWRDVYDTPQPEDDGNTENEEADSSAEDGIVCKNCGHKNSKDSIVCEKCGEFLTNNFVFTPFGNTGSEDADEDELEKIREQMRSVGPIMGSTNFYANGAGPFSFGFDETEDYDGVSAKELVDYVGGNALYYLPVFSKIKRFHTSRFNFAAFLLNGSWYFYRKQYLKGILISLAMIVLTVVQNLIYVLWAGELWDKANTALQASEQMPTYHQYMSWIQTNCTAVQALLMFLPYFLSFLSLVIMIVCGITANKGYYKKAVSSVRKIKSENPDLEGDALRTKIIRKGGVHLGAAFTLIACEMIINVAIQYFFS